MSVVLHGEAVEENTVLVDPTVQEKNIIYLADSKLAIKTISRLNTLVKEQGIRQKKR